MTTAQPTFGPLIETCARFGIKRNQAFQLQAKKLISTFKVGNKTFVTFESLTSLPERLAAASSTREAA